MKTLALVSLLFAALLVGCNDASPPGKNAAATEGDSLAGAPADYLKSTAASHQKAVKTVDLTAINKAIEAFYVQEGRFPKALQELVDKSLMHTLPLPPSGTKFNYDTNTGIVTLEKELGGE